MHVHKNGTLILNLVLAVMYIFAHSLRNVRLPEFHNISLHEKPEHLDADVFCVLLDRLF